MKIYLAGPMRTIAFFNQHSFDTATAKLRAAGHEVFSPSEHTRTIYGDDIYKNNPHGDEARAGVDGRRVFADDCEYICKHADAIALLPAWQNSKGATAERALGIALGLEIIELKEEFLK